MDHLLPYFTQWSMVILQLLIAMCCGGLIGYQREMHESPAGFRTHILVCVGAAVYMMMSVIVGTPSHDTGRIAAQVASGIGFLGAGTIIKQGSLVRGLTTAASLWAVAAIGLAIGYGQNSMAVALISTVIVFLALSVLKVIEDRITRPIPCMLTLTIASPREQIDWVRKVLVKRGVKLNSISLRVEVEGSGEITIEGSVLNADMIEQAVSEFTHSPQVSNVRWNCG